MGDDDDTKFVTLFNVSRTSRTTVKCHWSIRSISEGSCGNVKFLSRFVHISWNSVNFICSKLQISEGGANSLLHENYDGDANDDIYEDAMDYLPDEKV